MSGNVVAPSRDPVEARLSQLAGRRSEPEEVHQGTALREEAVAQRQTLTRPVLQ
jgi:hypothetical protein